MDLKWCIRTNEKQSCRTDSIPAIHGSLDSTILIQKIWDYSSFYRTSAKIYWPLPKRPIGYGWSSTLVAYAFRSGYFLARFRWILNNLPVWSEWIWFNCLILIELRLKLRIRICKSLINLSKLPLALTAKLLSTHLTSWIVSLINWTGCDLFRATKRTSATWCLARSKCMIVVGGWRGLKGTTL